MNQLLSLFATAGVVALATATAHAQGVVFESGGSNYVSYAVHPDYIKGCTDCSPFNDSNPRWTTWSQLLFLRDGFRHTVGDYHLDSGLVQQQLAQMYAAGQRKITLTLHLFAKASDCIGLPDRECHGAHAFTGGDATWGFALQLDTATWELRPQHKRNLHDVLANIRRIGFNQVNIRFCSYGELDPRGWRNGADTPWNSYHEYLYQIYWSALRSTIDSVNTWLPAEGTVRVFYDLNMEMANYLYKWNDQFSYGHTAEHSRRLWKDYVERYGNQRSIGFTMGNRALYPSGKGPDRDVISVLNRMVYDPVGQRPGVYAFDVGRNAPGLFSGFTDCRYPCYQTFFREVARQIHRYSPQAQMLVWEAPYNEARFADAVKWANKSLKMHIPYVIQWPSTNDGAHYTTVFPVDFSAYRVAPGK